MEPNDPINLDITSKAVALVSATHSGVAVKEILVARDWSDIQRIFTEGAWDESDGYLGDSLRAYTSSTDEFDQLVVAHFNHGWNVSPYAATYCKASYCGMYACFTNRPRLVEAGL